MKSKPLSEIEQAVETFVTVDCAVTYEVLATGEQTRGENWKCDGWRFAIEGQSFEYFTGVGHRELPIIRGVKKRPMSWDNVQSPHELARWKEANVKPVKPSIAGLLHSLILDGSACYESFASWCNNLGYDVDSRKALATYEACQHGFDKLRKVFTGAQIEHIRELLQDY